MTDDTHDTAHVEHGSGPFGHTETVARHPLTSEQIDRAFGDDPAHAYERPPLSARQLAYMGAHRDLANHKAQCSTCRLGGDGACIEANLLIVALRATREVKS